MTWATRPWVRWVVVAYFVAAQAYGWQQFATINPGTARTLPEIVVPAVAEIVVGLLLACYVILRSTSLVWVLLATVNAIVLLIVDFSIWYVSIGGPANWTPRLTRLDGLAITLGTLTTAGAPGITPHSELARKLVTVQLVVDILAVIVLFGLLVGRLVSHWRTAVAVEPQAAADPVTH
jgi:hypothetical protein